MINDPSSTVTLSTPLLLGSSSSSNKNMSTVVVAKQPPTNSSDDDIGTSFDWPEKESERVKLFIPPEYDPYQNQESPGQCYIRYDTERKLFMVVSETTDTTLDIIDPDDVIGVNVEIALFGSSDGGVTTSVQPMVVVVDGTMTNEPSSEIPVDRQGTAVLTLYVYPKRDPSADSIFNSCGLHRKPKPVTHYPTDATTGEDNASSTAGGSKKIWHRYAHHRQFTVAPVEDFADLTIMVQAIRSIVKPSTTTTTTPTTSREERLLVIINPVSGRKKALEIYEKTVVPIFDQACVSYDSLVTTHARHAEERMKQQPPSGDLVDLSEYTGIVSIGGDGVVHEIMQGIHNRPDGRDLLQRLKLGMIGAGSSNGLSTSLAHASEVWYCCSGGYYTLCVHSHTHKVFNTKTLLF